MENNIFAQTLEKMKKILFAVILLTQFVSKAQINGQWEKAEFKYGTIVHDYNNTLNYHLRYDAFTITISRLENGKRVKFNNFQFHKLTKCDLSPLNPFVLIEGDESTLYLIVKSFDSKTSDENYFLCHFDDELKLVGKPKLIGKTPSKRQLSFFGLMSKASSKNYIAFTFYKYEKGSMNTDFRLINRKTGEEIEIGSEIKQVLHLTDEGTLYSIENNNVITVTTVHDESNEIRLPDLGLNCVYQNFNFFRTENGELLLTGSYADTNNILKGFYSSKINESSFKVVDFSKMELDSNLGLIKSYLNESDQENQSFVKKHEDMDQNLKHSTLISLRGIKDLENGDQAMIFEENKANALISFTYTNPRVFGESFGLGLNRIYIVHLRDNSIFSINHFNFMSLGIGQSVYKTSKIQSSNNFEFFVNEDKIHFIFNEFKDYYNNENAYEAIGYEKVNFQNETAIDLTVNLNSGKEISRKQIYTDPNTYNYVDLNLISYLEDLKTVTYYLTVCDLKKRTRYFKGTFLLE